MTTKFGIHSTQISRVSNIKTIEIKNPELKSNDLLTDLIRGSAREMLAHAIELELQDFLTKHSELLINNNKSRIVRNGYLPERKITTGSGIKFIDGVKAKQQNIKINNSDKAA